MENIQELLSPEQLDAIATAYGSIEAFCSACGDLIISGIEQCSLIVEDLYP